MSRAKRQDVDVLALTDHDTTIGLQRAREQAEIEGLEFIHGIEFSCLWQGRGIHLVALNIDPDHPALVELVAEQSAVRQERAQTIADKLAALDMPDALQGARKYAGDGVIGRPHFAAFMVEKGYCKNVRQAFKKYLGSGKVGDIKQAWPQLEAVAACVRESGAVPVLAHPSKYNMTRTKLCAMVDAFKASGGLALEVVSGMQQQSVTQDLAKIANEYNLFASCGSDFHAPDQQWQELGKFSPMPDNVEAVWAYWE